MQARRHAYLAMAGPATVPRLRPPTPADGAALHDLIRRSPPLDLNSCYAYLLHGLHFADTCVLAETGTGTDTESGPGIAAWISAYLPPGRPDTLFVWQVAVDAGHRGHGLARTLLLHLLQRPACADVRWLETTVSPDNLPSRRLFQRLARELGCACHISDLFSTADFGAQHHEAEQLFRIGPITHSPQD